MKLKQLPKDFIVTEIISLETSQTKLDYTIYRLKKTQWGSFKIIEQIANKLKINTKFIGYAGNKDKQAVTTQYISFAKISKEKIDQLKIKDVELEFVGYSKERINLGSLKGNEFKITIRDLEKEVKLPENVQLENYFDDQRFGNNKNTHLIGKALLKKDFKEVCHLLKIKLEGNDYLKEIRKQQRRLLRFYIAAYQSYLWNKTLVEKLKKEDKTEIDYSIGKLIFTKSKQKNLKIPFVNFDTEEDKVIDKILKEEEISREDFIIRQMPELVTDTDFRDAFVDANIKYSWKEDELNKGKLKLELSFFLPKGSYATMLVKKLETYF